MARKSEDEKATDAAAEQVQEAVDEETAKGYRGVEVDQTPNESYTVAGVLKGAEVPEVSSNPAEARRQASNPDAVQ